MPVIDQRVVEYWIERGSTATNRVEQGNALQNLSCYIFRRIPGVSVAKRNRWDRPRSREFDVAFRNFSERNQFGFLGIVFLVECKNWGRRISASDVHWFAAKLRARGINDGIIVSRLGLSGNPAQGTGAHAIIEESRRDGLRIIDLTIEEICGLQDSAALTRLCFNKWMKLLLGP
jgi:hypothetical protein